MAVDYEKIREILADELDKKEEIYSFRFLDKDALTKELKTKEESCQNIFVKKRKYNRDKLKYAGAILALCITILVKILF